jgi:endonuclease G
MMKHSLKFLTLLCILWVTNASSAELIELKYDSWTTFYNCEKRGYEYFFYTTVPDTGMLKRYIPIKQEKLLPKKCQQFKTSYYTRPNGNSPKYDRGHGVHQNIWDHSKELMEQSNRMSNIVPQQARLNRKGGLWRKTEELTECWRDKGKVTVYGGNLWGEDKTNDHFIKSHGVVTPDYLWKLIIFPDGKVNAWAMPNSAEATGVKMDSYLVAPATLQKLTGVKFPISVTELNQKDTYSQKKPRKCSLK